MKLIVSNQIAHYGTAPDFEPSNIVYLGEPAAILNLVTDPHSNGAIRLFFWDEAKDCEYTTDSKSFLPPATN